MRITIEKLIALADKLDGLGLTKDADKLDQLVCKAAKGEDFGDLMRLFDEPVSLQDVEEAAPGQRMLSEIPEDEALTPIVEEKEVPPFGGSEQAPGRLGDIKRRHELMKLKRMLEKEEAKEKAEEVLHPDEVALPIATTEELEQEFEDEIEENEENNADDKSNTIDTIVNSLKDNPEILEKLLLLI